MTPTAPLTVYEKPTCTTCRKLRTLLEEEGVALERVNYMVQPLSEIALRDLLRGGMDSAAPSCQCGVPRGSA